LTDGRRIMSEERLLSKEDAEYLKQRFKEEMDKPVRIVVFIKEVGCRYCKGIFKFLLLQHVPIVQEWF